MDNEQRKYALKHSRKHDKELKYDFMPSMLEIIERPAHAAGTVIILGIFTLLIAAVIWACLSKTDIVVTSSGTIQPVGNISSLNSYASGTIKSINVEEGAYVKAGDVLIELDTQSLDIDADTLNNQKEVLEAQKKIYTMIRNNEDLTQVDISKYDVNLQPYILSIIDNDKAYRNNLSTLESAKENAGLNRDIANIKLEEYNTNENISQAEYDAQKLVVKQTENEFIQAETNVLKAQITYSEQVNSNLSEINGKLSQIGADLEKYRLSIENQKIVAPINGYINNIAVNNVGETVTSAQQVVTIVPADTPVEMVCYVKNMDIADIKTGMDAEIKLEAYPYNKYGTVKGKVKYISPSSFNTEKMGSVYLVKLDVENSNPKINVMSGLTGAVEVKVGKRSIMRYFLDPIVKGFGGSMKEK
ncbi:MAG: HlyD family secretion protein [Ruminococcus sp.]|uniref:HlyD family efflux transporter periplasmic adaptor subunit n=1 Tax=Ruminococcus sp. TaxID=41978 RepID=UPI0025DB47D9|nr:HlyD family efflux transporter periplasmic adaptor subunit [Ruminococcus sp.]MCR5600893.1 HlyD family secretion protein [Ruminococcus sp.]